MFRGALLLLAGYLQRRGLEGKAIYFPLGRIGLNIKLIESTVPNPEISSVFIEEAEEVTPAMLASLKESKTGKFILSKETLAGIPQW